MTKRPRELNSEVYAFIQHPYYTKKQDLGNGGGFVFLRDKSGSFISIQDKTHYQFELETSGEKVTKAVAIKRLTKARDWIDKALDYLEERK